MEIIDRKMRKLNETLVAKHRENLEELATDDHSIVQPRTSGCLITRSLLEIFIVLRVNGAFWQKRAKLAEINVFPVKRSCVIFHASGFWHVARTDAGVSRAISQKSSRRIFRASRCNRIPLSNYRLDVSNCVCNWISIEITRFLARFSNCWGMILSHRLFQLLPYFNWCTRLKNR